VFNLYNNDRLIEWKKFRDSLETSQTPLEDVAILWSQAPFVSPYLNPNQPTEWPDPWHLVLNSKLDELAIVLGMLYTLKLTQRFIGSQFEIHMSTVPRLNYLLVVDNFVLNLEYRSVVGVEELSKYQTSKIWSN
jgi:hypothetical protein